MFNGENTVARRSAAYRLRTRRTGSYFAGAGAALVDTAAGAFVAMAACGLIGVAVGTSGVPAELVAVIGTTGLSNCSCSEEGLSSMRARMV